MIAEEGVTVDTVRAAADRLSGLVQRTPLISDPRLDHRLGAQLLLKAEHLQRSGSYKFRGLCNRIARLAAESPEPGTVLVVTSGNAGGGAALAARLFDWSCIIVTPSNGVPHKIAAAQGYGAQWVDGGPDAESAFATGRALAEADEGLVPVHPFDDDDVISGNATIGLELAGVLDSTDTVVAPASGGGLLAGVAFAVKRLNPHVRVVGVQPTGSDALRRSLEAGSIVRIDHATTIADGLVAQAPGARPFAIVQRYVDEIITVEDDEIRGAMADAWIGAGSALEPAGATALAGARKLADSGTRRLVVVGSGGNVDLGALAMIVKEHDR